MADELLIYFHVLVCTGLAQARWAAPAMEGPWGILHTNIQAHVRVLSGVCVQQNCLVHNSLHRSVLSFYLVWLGMASLQCMLAPMLHFLLFAESCLLHSLQVVTQVSCTQSTPP